jgi:hypothetical protein
MHDRMLALLRDHIPQIRHRWEILLRVEPVSGPLANPDALQYLIPTSIKQVLDRLTLGLDDACGDPVRLPGCECGNNPYRAYFAAGEQAFAETMVLIQVRQAPAERSKGDFTQVVSAVRRLARQEIDGFCEMCLHRGHAPRCRHAPLAVVI